MTNIYYILSPDSILNAAKPTDTKHKQYWEQTSRIITRQIKISFHTMQYYFIQPHSSNQLRGSTRLAFLCQLKRGISQMEIKITCNYLEWIRQADGAWLTSLDIVFFVILKNIPRVVAACDPELLRYGFCSRQSVIHPISVSIIHIPFEHRLSDGFQYPH